MKNKIFIGIGLLILVGIIYYANSPELQNIPSHTKNSKLKGPYHKDLINDKDYLFYFNQEGDSSFAKRLYKAEKHLQEMEDIRYKLGRDDDIGFNDSSYVFNGILYLRFIFGLKDDPDHRYAYNMNTDYVRTKVYEVRSDIELTKKVSTKSNLSKIDKVKFLSSHRDKLNYNTEKWRIEAYKTALEYLKRKIPLMEPNCSVTSQGYYNPNLVSYHGNGTFKIKAKTNFDCNHDYINKKLFFITITHLPEGWKATITDMKFLD